MYEKSTRLIQVQRYHSMLGTKQNRISFQEFQKQQTEARLNYQEQSNAKIGQFNFSYDDDIEAEVLNADLVYKDLAELEEMLDRTRSK